MCTWVPTSRHCAQTERDSDTLNNPESRDLGRIWQAALSSTGGLKSAWIQGYYQSFHLVSGETSQQAQTYLLSIQSYIIEVLMAFFMSPCTLMHGCKCVCFRCFVMCFLNSICISLLQGKGRLVKHSGWCHLAIKRLTWHQWTDLAAANRRWPNTK